MYLDNSIRKLLHNGRVYSTDLYWYHRSRKRFLWTIGFVNKMAKANPDTVSTSCNLLKFSLRTSKVFDGATLVRNKSNPCAKTNDVDSNNAGAVMMCWIFATCGDEINESVTRGRQSSIKEVLHSCVIKHVSSRSVTADRMRRDTLPVPPQSSSG